MCYRQWYLNVLVLFDETDDWYGYMWSGTSDRFLGNHPSLGRDRSWSRHDCSVQELKEKLTIWMVWLKRLVIWAISRFHVILWKKWFRLIKVNVQWKILIYHLWFRFAETISCLFHVENATSNHHYQWTGQWISWIWGYFNMYIYVVIVNYTGSYYPNFSDNQVWARLQPRVSRDPTGWCRCSAPTGWYSNGVPRLPLVSQWSVHRVHGPVSEAAEGLRHVQRPSKGPGGNQGAEDTAWGDHFKNFWPWANIMSQLFPWAHRTRSNGGTDSMFGFFYLPPGSGANPTLTGQGVYPQKKTKAWWFIRNKKHDI